MDFILIIIGGLIGAYLFSKKENNIEINQKKTDDFWYNYNHPKYTRNVRYNNHCWKCGSKIDSFYNERCSKCGWYICHKCGACQHYPNCEKR